MRNLINLKLHPLEIYFRALVFLNLDVLDIGLVIAVEKTDWGKLKNILMSFKMMKRCFGIRKILEAFLTPSKLF